MINPDSISNLLLWLDAARCVALNPNLLTNGDCESLVGWTPSTGGPGLPVLSLQSAAPEVGQCIRVTSTGGAAGSIAVYQVQLNAGVQYRVTGRVRSDGTRIPTIYDSVIRWTGTTDVNWQYFDVSWTASVAQFQMLFTTTAAGQYVEMDNFILTRTAGSAVSRWDDPRGVRYASQATALNQPTYLPTGGVNGLPGVKFYTQYLSLTGGLANVSNNWTVFAVLDQTFLIGIAQCLVGDGANKFLCGTDYGAPKKVMTYDGTAFRLSTADTVTGPQLLSWVYDSATLTIDMRRNGVSIGTPAYDGTFAFATTPTIGSGGVATYTYAILSELLVFARTLSESEITQINNYLLTKYFGMQTSKDSINIDRGPQYSYVMCGRDDGATPPGYVTWTSDFYDSTGIGFFRGTPAPVGHFTVGSAFALSQKEILPYQSKEIVIICNGGSNAAAAPPLSYGYSAITRHLRQDLFGWSDSSHSFVNLVDGTANMRANTGGGGTGPGPGGGQMASLVCRRIGDVYDTVKLFAHAYSSQSISYFLPGSTTLAYYEDGTQHGSLNNYNLIKQEVTTSGKTVNWIIWCQGEADAGITQSAYYTNFAALVAQWHIDYPSAKICVIGTIGDSSSLISGFSVAGVRAAQLQVATENHGLVFFIDNTDMQGNTAWFGPSTAPTLYTTYAGYEECAERVAAKILTDSTRSNVASIDHIDDAITWTHRWNYGHTVTSVGGVPIVTEILDTAALGDNKKLSRLVDGGTHIPYDSNFNYRTTIDIENTVSGGHQNYSTAALADTNNQFSMFMVGKATNLVGTQLWSEVYLSAAVRWGFYNSEAGSQFGYRDAAIDSYFGWSPYSPIPDVSPHTYGIIRDSAFNEIRLYKDGILKFVGNTGSINPVYTTPVVYLGGLLGTTNYSDFRLSEYSLSSKCVLENADIVKAHNWAALEYGSAITTLAADTGISPQAVNLCERWFQGEAANITVAGSGVSAWVDTIQAHSGSQATDADRPGWLATGGVDSHGGVWFDLANTEAMSMVDAHTTYTNCVIFCVLDVDTVGTQQYVVYNDTSSALALTSTSYWGGYDGIAWREVGPSVVGTQLIELHWISGYGAIAYKNGICIGSTDYLGNFAGINLGMGGSLANPPLFPLNGTVSELAIFANPLCARMSPSTLESIRRYFSLRYPSLGIRAKFSPELTSNLLMWLRSDTGVTLNPNLLTNGDCESVVGWGVTGTNSIVSAAPEVGNCIRCTATAAGLFGIYQSPMTIGVQYNVTGRMRSDGTRVVQVANGNLHVYWLGTNDINWQTFSFNFTAITDTYVIFDATAAAAGDWIEIDNLVLTRTAGPVVSSWADKINPSTIIFSQATATKQPVCIASHPAFNGLPALDFDGTDDSLSSATDAVISANLSYTLFAIVDSDTADTSNRVVFGTHDNTGIDFYHTYGSALHGVHNGVTTYNVATSAPKTGKEMITYQVNDGTGLLQVWGDGISQGTVAADINRHAGLISTVGGGFSPVAGFFNGRIAELLLYDRALTTAEITDVHEYLRGRYNFQFQPTDLYGLILWLDAAQLVTTNPNLLTNGDCESLVGWSGVAATISIVSALPEAGNCIRITATGAGGFAKQTANISAVGETVRVTGRMRGDGVGTGTPYIVETITRWTGTNSTDWQYFDITFVQTGASILFSGGFSGAGPYVDMDNLVLTRTAGSAVSRWDDPRGTRYASQATALNQPTYLPTGGVNGLPGVKFLPAGMSCMVLTGGLANVSNNWTVFAVLNQVTTAGTQVLLSDAGVKYLAGNNETAKVMAHDGTAYRLAGAATVGPQVLSWIWNSATLTIDMRRNGVSIGTPAYDGTFAFIGVPVIGSGVAGVSNPMDAILSELLIYSRTLSAAEIARVETALNLKYSTYMTRLEPHGVASIESLGVPEVMTYVAAPGVASIESLGVDTLTLIYEPDDVANMAAWYKDPAINTVLNSNLFSDGDMEAVGIASWTVGAQGTAAKSVVHAHGGSQSLRVTAIAGAGVKYPQVSQTRLTVGMQYIVSVWFYTDGVQTPQVINGASPLWAGVPAAGWQGTGTITFTATSSTIQFYFMLTDPAGTEWIELDDVVVTRTAGSAVSTWNDSSGNLRHLPQATAINQPTLITGAVPYIAFDGVNQYMKLTWVQTQPVTTFIVSKPSVAGGKVNLYLSDGGSAVNSNAHYHGGGGGINPKLYAGGSPIISGPIDQTTWQYWTTISNGASSSISDNGRMPTVGNIGTTDPNGISLGASFNGTQPLDCLIAEVIQYSRALSATEIAGINNYLQAKYASLLPSLQYLSAPGIAPVESIGIATAQGGILWLDAAKGITTNPNLLVNGDCESLVGWTDYVNAVSSLVSAAPNPNNAIRVTSIAAGAAYTANNWVVFPGEQVRATGQMRSDGTAVPTLLCNSVQWTGTTSTNWQNFDVTFTAGNWYLAASFTATAGGQFIEFDNMVLTRTAGSAVSAWADPRGVRYASQATALLQPTYLATGGVNGLPGIKFLKATPGAEQFMSLTGGLANITNDWTVFAVINQVSITAATAQGLIWDGVSKLLAGLNNSASGKVCVHDSTGYLLAGDAITGAQILSWVWDSVALTIDIRRNGISIGTPVYDGTFAFAGTPTIGGATGAILGVDAIVSELIIHPRLLSGAEITAAENALKAKYGL